MFVNRPILFHRSEKTTFQINLFTPTEAKKNNTLIIKTMNVLHKETIHHQIFLNDTQNDSCAAKLK